MTSFDENGLKTVKFIVDGMNCEAFDGVAARAGLIANSSIIVIQSQRNDESRTTH